MRIRFWQVLFLAVFFAGFLPAALACEVSAQGHSPCMAVRCDHPARVVHCASEGALESVPLPKIGGDDAPQLSLPPVLVFALDFRNAAPSPHLDRKILFSPLRSTLLAPTVLLRI